SVPGASCDGHRPPLAASSSSPELTANAVIAAISTTTRIAARGTTQRRGRSLRTDEGVDGNGREQQREVRVGEREHADRARCRRLAPETQRFDDQGDTEQGCGDDV